MKWPPGFSSKSIWRATNIDNLSNETNQLPESVSAPVPQQRGGGGKIRASLRWVRTHKFLTVCVLILLFVLTEALTIPWFDVARLRTENPGLTALMQQRIDEAKAAGKSFKISQRWIPIARLPETLVQAVIVEEDGTFYSHGGIDWFEVKESIEKDLQERRAARGASTITQQLAKNLYLSTSKDPLRKVKELIITLLLEQQLSKDRILELYLNVIEWGRGIFGVEAAARSYFGKSAADLSLEEAVRLAAVIPSPLRHAPDADSRYVARRRQMVLDRMAARNMINHPIQGETLSSADTTAVSGAPPDTGQSTDTLYPDTTGVDEDGHDGL